MGSNMFRPINSKYIVFEGTDGCGKTSIAKAIYDALPGEKIFTKEPGSPHLETCVKIRELILHGASQDLDPISYAYLFAADTHEHMTKIVTPALLQDQWVVSDRSVISDYAYRPNAGDSIRFNNWQRFISMNPKVFLIDALPGTCLDRMKARGPMNDFEIQHVVDKIVSIRKAYYEVAMPKVVQGDFRCSYVVQNNNKLQNAIDDVKRMLLPHFEELRDLEEFYVRDESGGQTKDIGSYT